MGDFLRDVHHKNFPTIRLAAIKLENFKSVKIGEIVFSCGRKHIPYATQSDILGLYGQNGSGKTSLIEAISILKYLLSGKEVPGTYADCVDVTAEYSSLTFTFDFQYPEGNEYPTNEDVRKVVYSFKLSRNDNKIKSALLFHDFDCVSQGCEEAKVKVYDEVLKVGGTILGQKQPLKPFVDTYGAKTVFGPATKAKMLLGTLDEEKRIQLGVNKRIASEKAMSFIFMKDTMELCGANSNYSVYYQMLLELRMWGRYSLHVVDSKSTGMIRMNVVLPMFNGVSMQMVPITDRFTLDGLAYEKLRNSLNGLDMVMSQIVPGLSLNLKIHEKKIHRAYNNDPADYYNNDCMMPPPSFYEYSDAGYNDDKDYSYELDYDDEHERDEPVEEDIPEFSAADEFTVELYARRGNVEIPLRSESDGVRKLISTLYYLVAVYNDPSVTVAYDEFDAGVFEYLLGEILQVIQSSGKGQFIFTSHNMRPLEVLKKDFVWFTTTDQEDRYIKMTGLGESNNLRKVYYREIAMHDNYDNLYSDTKRNLIVSAMRKAGGR